MQNPLITVNYRYTPLCSFYTAGRLPHRSISGGKLYATEMAKKSWFFCLKKGFFIWEKRLSGVYFFHVYL